MDRRTALKTLGAAGAAAWVAPVIASTPAAAAACTIKCAPVVSGSPLTIDATQGPCTGQGQSVTKIVYVDFKPAGSVTCPCGGTPAALVVQPGSWTPPNGNGTVTPSVGPHPTNSSWSRVTLSINDNGNFTSATAFVTFGLNCPDRSGVLVTRSCTVNVSLTFQSGNCNQWTQGIVATVTQSNGQCNNTPAGVSCP